MSAGGQKDARVELGIDSSGIVVLRFTTNIDEERMREALAFIRKGAKATGRVLILCDYQDGVPDGHEVPGPAMTDSTV
jgi:hypothetical protein